MRLTIVGGGGFRTPLVVRAVALARTRVDIAEIVLVDVDPARLRTIEAVIRADLSGVPDAPAVHVSTDLDSAVRGADVVFSAIRVGGAAGRVVDERVALERGMLGQETIGAGGVAYAWRTVPVVDDLARRIAALAPKAWTINFTNPAGLITEAMSAQLGDRVLGICDTPIGLVRRVARATGVDPGEAVVDYLGLNHLGWLRGLSVSGHDVLPGLLADDDALAGIEEARVLGFEWVRSRGVLPNEYLWYYTNPEAAAARIGAAEQTRGEFLVGQQGEFYRAASGVEPARARELWLDTLRRRESTYMAEARADGEQRDEADVEGGYHEVAVDLMAALLADESCQAILDVRNGGQVAGIPDDAVVEIPCRLDAAGVRPLGPTAIGAAQPAGEMLALMAALKASERASIEAGRTGSRAAAARSLALHPLVGSEEVARDLLAGYLAASPAIASVLREP